MKRSEHRLTLAWSLLIAAAIGWSSSRSAEAQAKLVLVEDGVSLAPIVIFKDAPPITRRTADELAEYVERVSRAKPKVMEGRPGPLPERAIWVGYQPVLKSLFPKIDFDFKRPEEILIAANDKHLVIAGRDIWAPGNLVLKRERYTVYGMQQEYGTANAVYTFIQDFLDVRWLWPGELGIDVIEKKTIAFEPFVYRYAPRLRSRRGLFQFCLPHAAKPHSNRGYGHSDDWVRRQRIMLDSLYVHPGHAFKDWWGRFHETLPKYFALQPDGTRGGGDSPYPYAKMVKLCQSNPAVWRQWLRDVETQIAEDPALTCFSAQPNDGYGLGHCVCENCKAWDEPGADLRPFIWSGVMKRAPALSDRHVTFANHCARLLKERFPDKDYRVSMLAYGNSRPAPLRAVPAGNVIINNCSNFFWGLDVMDKDTVDEKTYAQEYANWGKVTENQIWRPNPGNPAGWWAGLPEITPERTMESFQFAIDNHCIGIIVDSILEQWATQGPLYYVLAKMTWDPSQDWRAVMDEYYQRGFGPAAPTIKAYWQLIEDSRNRLIDDYPSVPRGFLEVYDDAFFKKTYALLDQAVAQVADAQEKYRKRVEFVRAGLDFTRLADEIRRLSVRMFAEDMKNAKTNDLLRAKWKALEATCHRLPHAMDWPPLRPHNDRMARSGLFHPDHMGRMRAKHLGPWRQLTTSRAKGERVDFRKAEEAGWELVFSDDFDRDELGKDWKVVGGKWEVKDGALHGGGVLVSTRTFPGDRATAYQRMEFDASVDMTKGRISDLSSVLHIKDATSESEALESGYFFQFGGRWNQMHQITRAGKVLVFDTSPNIKIHRWEVQRIVVENDNGRMSLFVDGKSILTAREKESLIGSGHGRVGFYFFTPVRVTNVKVYVKRLSEGLDMD